MGEDTNRRAWLIGGGVAGAAAAGVAAWWLTRTETPDYSLVLKDGAFAPTARCRSRGGGA